MARGRPIPTDAVFVLEVQIAVTEALGTWVEFAP